MRSAGSSPGPWAIGASCVFTLELCLDNPLWLNMLLCCSYNNRGTCRSESSELSLRGGVGHPTMGVRWWLFAEMRTMLSHHRPTEQQRHAKNQTKGRYPAGASAGAGADSGGAPCGHAKRALRSWCFTSCNQVHGSSGWYYIIF